MAKFDMNAMLKQAQQMQAQMMEAQEQAKLEIVEASAGGGMVTVKANGGGEIVEIGSTRRRSTRTTPRCWPTS